MPEDQDIARRLLDWLNSATALPPQLPSPWDAVIAAITRFKSAAATRATESSRLRQELIYNLAYGAGHDLNNPLANISARAEALLREETHPDRRRLLANIQGQARRGHEMLADLMLLAKPPALQRASLAAEVLLDSALAELRRRATEQATSLTEICDGELHFDADRAALASAVYAVALNALEAVGEGGAISVRAVPAETPRFGEIIVRDSGPGISPEALSQVFDPFYSGREAGRGLGFGLCKARRVAELHGGTLDLESELGFGTTARFRLPLAAESTS